MKIKQRDIILINFPFSDLTGTKVRPALVISNDLYNQENSDALVLAITSNVSKNKYKIIVDCADLESGNLPVKSAIRVDKPFSIIQTKILKIQGRIKYEKLEEVRLLIHKLIQ